MRTTAILITMIFLGALNAQENSPGNLAGVAKTRSGIDVDADHNAANSSASRATMAYNDALDKLANGDANGAIIDLEKVLAADQRDAYALLGRAEAYTALGQHERASYDLWNVLGIQPRGAVAERALQRLGQRALDESDHRSAELFFDRFVKIAPYDAHAYCGRGMARAALRQDDAALEDLDQAIGFDPELDKAYVNKAIILLRNGSRQEGCAALQLARDLGDLSTEELLLIHCDR